MGRNDGVLGDAAWASQISGIAADEIARQASRAQASASSSSRPSALLQRAEHGEQLVWMAAAFAAMLGQFDYWRRLQLHCAMANFGCRANAVPISSLPAGATGQGAVYSLLLGNLAELCCSIPTNRSTIMAGRCATPISGSYTGPAANPFHHHQDLNRLRKALANIETFVVRTRSAADGYRTPCRH